MLKSRNQRIRTDYSKVTSSFNQHKPSRQQQKRKSTLSNDRQSYITRTLNSINHEVKYDALSIQHIEAERDQLRLKVKEMNTIINGLIAKELDARYDESRVSKKATIVHQMGIDLPSLSREAQANSIRIQQLQLELQENLARLGGLNNLQAKVEQGRRMGETQAKLKELREQLGRIRKNKLLREKQIMKGNVKENEQIQCLQQEYITCSKKVEHIATRLQTVQQELADSDFSLDKQKDFYDQLKVECSLIDDSEERQQAQHEEMLLTYNTKKRKLELYAKRNEKDLEAKKKKYYNLLLQYQERAAHEQSLQERTNIATDKNEAALQTLAKLLQHLKSLTLSRPVRKSTSNYQPFQQPDRDLFELTEPDYRKQYPSKPQYVSSFSNKILVQNQLNKGNARNRSFVRKWKLEGSIVHQNLSQQRQLHSINQAESEEELDRSAVFKSGTANESRKYRSSKVGKQIRHFKTENSPNSQNHSIIRTHLDEEQYKEDFEM